MKSNLSIFPFMIVFCFLSKKTLHRPRSQRFSPMFYLYIVLVLAFTFRSTTQVKFIFLCGLSKAYKFPVAAVTKFHKLSG